MLLGNLQSSCSGVKTAILLFNVAYIIGCCQVVFCASQIPPGDSNHRIAVAFSKHHRQQVRNHLNKGGFHILFEGPDFFTVALESPQVPAPNLVTKARARRRLIARQRQQESAKLVKALGSIPGVSSSEQDVRRFLHVRPSEFRPWRSHSSRILASVAGSSASADKHAGSAATAAHKQQAPGKQKQTTHRLAGHWHQSELRYSQYQPGPYDVWGSEVSAQSCASEDTQVADAAGAEVIPWGIKRIGAWNATLQTAAAKGRVIVCVVDSGLWISHPEYSSTNGSGNQDTLAGCKSNANCPYDWESDEVGHGTHVAGTIGAPLNGLGVVGVVSKGVDMYIVRIWNDSGAVSQGQGPFATDLILAYEDCLTYLKEQQKADKSTKMVINMSFGSAGPLTVERLWIQRAAKRGDVLFVGSSGNNGSWYRAADAASRGQPDPGQYLSYPASYDVPEMISVANAHCDDTIDFSSQKNKRVSIAAPGMAILSSVPRQDAAVRAYIVTDKPILGQTEPQHAAAGARDSNSQHPSYGVPDSIGVAAPGEVRRGLGLLPNGYREPRPVRGTRLGSTGMLPLVQCSVATERGQHPSRVGYAKLPTELAEQQQEEDKEQLQQPGCKGVRGAVCLVELLGNMDWYKETCLAMLQCLRGGGKGLVLWRRDQLMESLYTSGDASDYHDQYDMQDEYLLGTRVDCGTKCACWSEVKRHLACNSTEGCAQKIPPAIVVSSKHARALAAAAAGKTSNNSAESHLRVNITNFEYPYRHFDGTSMAAPHVSGAAALLWRLFPQCTAAAIADALHKSAEKLPGQTASGRDMAAGYGMLRVDRAFQLLQRINCEAR